MPSYSNESKSVKAAACNAISIEIADCNAISPGPTSPQTKVALRHAVTPLQPRIADCNAISQYNNLERDLLKVITKCDATEEHPTTSIRLQPELLDTDTVTAVSSSTSIHGIQANEDVTRLRYPQAAGGCNENPVIQYVFNSRNSAQLNATLLAATSHTATCTLAPEKTEIQAQVDIHVANGQ